MEEKIRNLIVDFVRSKNREGLWREPIVGYADASDSLFKRLREVTYPGHFLPEELLPEAKTVVVFFIPFDKRVVESNLLGNSASRFWAYSYIATNQLLVEISEMLKEFFRKKNIKCAVILPTHNFDREKLVSRWSHRHAGYIAGIGKFGLNNMLITKSGCAGRTSSIIIDLEMQPSPRDDDEYCLYKRDESCTVCVEKCVNDSLRVSGFNRFSCWQRCLENGELYTDLGSPSVCGKCVVGLPCTYEIPLLKESQF